MQERELSLPFVPPAHTAPTPATQRIPQSKTNGVCESIIQTWNDMKANSTAVKTAVKTKNVFSIIECSVEAHAGGASVSLSSPESTMLPQAVFESLDANHDGVVSREVCVCLFTTLTSAQPGSLGLSAAHHNCNYNAVGVDECTCYAGENGGVSISYGVGV